MFYSQKEERCFVRKKELIKGALGVLMLAFFYATRNTWLQILLVVFLSGIFALLLMPVCRWLERKGLPTSAASLVSILVLLLGAAAVILLFLPLFCRHAAELVRRISTTWTAFAEQVNVLAGKWGFGALASDSIQQLAAAFVKPLTTGIARSSAALLSALGHTAFSLVLAYYLLTTHRRAGKHLLMLIPMRLRPVVLLALSGCKNAAMSYLAGMFKTSVFVGAATSVGLLLLGIDGALILGLMMGFLEVLPYAGPVIGAIPILISAIPMGKGTTALALGLIVLVQQLESSVAGPYFTATSTSLHPLAAILCVFVGGSLFGIWGILLAVPLLIMGRSILWSVRSAANRFES